MLSLTTYNKFALNMYRKDTLILQKHDHSMCQNIALDF